MEIQSTFNAGLEGFQKATEKANEAAAIIAVQTYVNPSDVQLSQKDESAVVDQNQQLSQLPNINQSIVDLKVAEFQAKASTEVIKTADENLGTLLDVRV
jgi:hypothetical protein|tara:strand:+ start:331 stop:627 length:297 start_codon:yes stop_codon:yes gene_type:complete